MKTKLKPVKLSAKRAVAVPRHAPVVPLNDRRLNFGDKWDYAPAPEDSKSYVIAPRHDLFINGKFVAPHSGKHFDTINPATEDKITEIALGDAEDVDLAVKAARRAYEKIWSKMPGRERGKYLTASRASSRKRCANWPCSKAWTAASPSRKRATWICPSSPRTFFITPAGRTNCNTPFPAARRVHWAWPARLFRGIFRC